MASLWFALDGDRALHLQIYDAIRARILGGLLAPGVRLPSSRRLAADLGVARTTVLQATEALVAEGYLETHRASATRVVPAPPELGGLIAPPPDRARRPPRLSRMARSLAALPAGSPRLGGAPRAFRPGAPALDRFPLALWARLTARVHARATTALLDGGDPAGLAPLRAAIAAHVGAARGLHCTAAQVFVTTGTQAAYDELLRAVVDPGDPVWVEDPGYLGARRAVVAAGARPVAVPVDDHGLDVAAGLARAPAARAVVLAPSHQYPLGVTLSLPRRLALVRWAARTRAVVIEDDYDSEFRHRGRPVAALAGLAPAHVAYVGTFSKSVFPGLRLGYFIAPPALVDAIAAARASLPAPASALDQAVLAAFIADGHFATHLRRMRGVYRERGEALRAALAVDCAGALTARPCDTGMQLVCTLAGRTADHRAVAAAARHGVEVAALSSYGHARGLVLGFGGVRPQAIRAGSERLAAALASLARPAHAT